MKTEDGKFERRRGQIIYKGECLDSNDPLRLGRIRAIQKTENVQDREAANENYGEKTYQEWDSKDPFIYKPLLPYFLNTPPKKGEYVHLFFSNITRKGDKDKYYIGGVYSSPTNVYDEQYDSALANLDEGVRNKNFLPLIKNENIEDITSITNLSNGVFAEPVDIAIYGRGTSDIIIKENEVLLRSGKNKKYVKNQGVPKNDDSRSFLQLSKFTQTTKEKPPVQYFGPIKLDLSVQHLIEFGINSTYLDNAFSSFTGNITIYHITEDVKCSSLVENPQYPISESNKRIVTNVSFSQLRMNQVIELVNNVIKKLASNKLPEIEDSTTPFISISNPVILDNKKIFPFYYRMTENMYSNLINLSGGTITGQANINVRNLKNGVKVNASDTNPGQGLVYDKKFNQNVPTEFKKQEVIEKIVTPENKTVGIMGGDELYLLSHKTQNQGGKISFEDTPLYGITENQLANEIIPKTSSVVRGEELLDLINLIIRFLIGHVHAYPGLSPVGQSLNGVSIEDLIKALQEANTKILNDRIRIN